MSRKQLTVPLSAGAAQRIHFNTSTEGELLEVTLDDQQYQSLRDTGLFELLNSALDLLIADGEDAEIVGVDDLQVARSIARSYADAHPNSLVLAQFVELLDAAIAAETKFMMFF